MQRNTVLAASVILALTALLIGWWFKPSRWEVVGIHDSAAVRLDRTSGEMWLVAGLEALPIVIQAHSN